jgi:hypothetical protein
VVFSTFSAGILKEQIFVLQLGFSVSGFHGGLQPTGMKHIEVIKMS